MADLSAILVVDDHPIVRQGIAQVLAQHSLAERFLQANNQASALKVFTSAQPGIVIIDLALGDENGIDLVRALRRLSSDVRILVLSMHDERDHAAECLRAGADGYVMKHDATEHLVEAILNLKRGNVAISPAMQTVLLRGSGARAPSAASAVAMLSDKERSILELLSQGLSSAEIAERQHRSIKTIEAHRAAIRGKLGLRTAVELIRFAALWHKQR